ARDVVIAFTLLPCTSKNRALSYIEFVLQRDRDLSVLRNRNALSLSEDPGTVGALRDGVVARDPAFPEEPASRRRPPFTAACPRSPAGGAVALHPGHRPQARLVAQFRARRSARPAAAAALGFEAAPPPARPEPPGRQRRELRRPPPRAPGARLH